jgi:hypothetical protein
MPALWGYGLAGHLIKQAAVGKADNATLDLGAALTGYRTFQTLGDGYCFYWVVKADDSYEYGYGELDATAGEIARRSDLVMFSSTGSMLSIGTSDSVTVTCPVNPNAMGVRGCQIAGASFTSVADQTETQLTWSDTNSSFDTEGLVDTNQLVIPQWAAIVEVSALITWGASTGGTYRKIKCEVGEGLSLTARTDTRPALGGEQCIHFGVFERYSSATPDADYQNIKLFAEHDAGTSLDVQPTRVTCRILQ